MVLDDDLQAILKILDGHVKPIGLPLNQGQRLVAKILEHLGEQVASSILEPRAGGKVRHCAAHRGHQSGVRRKMHTGT